jgi:hypothetical protein
MPGGIVEAARLTAARLRGRRPAAEAGAGP